MKTASVFRGLAYGTEILLSRSLKLENKNKFNESLDQPICDSLYRKDISHKELESVISESQLGALLYINWTVRYMHSLLSTNRIHKHITSFISLQLHYLRLFAFIHESAHNNYINISPS